MGVCERGCSREVFDLIVVGAGPAGCSAALGALRARSDAKVLIIDRDPPGRDKVCGDGIGPDAVAELAALGLTGILRPEEMVSRIRIAAHGAEISAVVPRPAYIVARAEFDLRLLRAAVAAAAVFREHSVRVIGQGADRILVDGMYSAPVMIGADGANSVTRRAAGQPPNRSRDLAVAVRGYVPAPEGLDELYIRWDHVAGHGLSYAWAFPTAHGRANIGYGTTTPAPGRAWLAARAVDLLPEFSVSTAQMAGHLLPLSTHRPLPAVGRVLLAGDAASCINPLTGEGIFYAIASGGMAGRAAVGPEPGPTYVRALRARFGRQDRQLRALSRTLSHPNVVAAGVRACARDERVFRSLMGVGLGDGVLELIDFARFIRAALRR
ncbi:geranylgeranyl reductase family protein [Arthrobacter sp. CC3]|uniref:geranylgeranyl reductase family protein n=1 Tax=Arthrobacter sp. CC3 TaxID=3029185 RepID=UPI0032667A7A